MVAALYRRYRPETFAEMIGQSQVTEPLMTALRTGRVAHAYLFSGPRGCGKTTSARVLARCLNCAEGPTDTPCGTCASCVELSRDGGGSLDVVEIDAASHGGVDDARDLRERAVFAPARDRYKIFIIDEAHMVTAGGFNALLKIVEEPPPHVKFIFATTEPEKVIGTIRSRTHHYPFRLIAPGVLIDYVQQLCESEGVRVEPGVLPLVVRAGGGSVRDTLSILDQLIAGSEGDLVTAERATGLLGVTSSELLDDVVTSLGRRDAAAAFRATDRVVQTGQDPRRFVEDLLERLRDLIVVNATTVDGAAAVFRGVPQDQLTRMFEQAQVFGAAELSAVADTVVETLDQMTGVTSPKLQLELMVARALVGLGPGASVSQARPETPAEAQTAAVQQPEPVRPAVPQAVAPQPVAPQPAAPRAVPDAAEPAAPNAAQTAASIREFLREAPATAAAPPAVPAPSGPAGERHPNEGAAGFGRPISDVLSTAQIESIGTEPRSPAPPAPAPVTPAPAAAAEPSASTPAATPPDEPAPGVEPAAQGTPASPATPESPEADGAAAGLDGAPDLSDLQEVWPDLLEEILEQDRAAWNAVAPVQPLALAGDVLTVGVASKSDLDSFKTTGAGPLREAILSAIGIRVKYLPRQIPPSTGGREAQQNGVRGDTPPAAAEEPHRAGSGGAAGSDAAPAADDTTARVAARLQALGPALAAPGWADPEPVSEPPSEPVSAAPPEPSTPPPADDFEPDFPDEADDPYASVAVPVPATAPDAEAARSAGSAAVPTPDPTPEAGTEPQPAPAPEPDPDRGPAPRSAPAFTRYGEAIVREVLGAVFIEEHPLPPRAER